MEQITLGELAAAIVLLGAVVSVLIKAFKPIEDNKQLMEEHERKLDNDHEEIAALRNLTNAQSLAMIQMMNHMVDGNHVDQLKAARDELQRAVIEVKL